MEKDEKIRESYGVFMDADGLLNLSFRRTQREPEYQLRQSELVGEDIGKIFRNNPGEKYSVIVDTLLLEDQPAIAAGARKNYAAFASLPQVARIAVLGRSLFYKVVVTFISRTAGKRLGWFENRKGAIDWLMEK